jgi:hypothetical protein
VRANYSRRSPSQRMPTILGGWSANRQLSRNGLPGSEKQNSGRFWATRPLLVMEGANLRLRRPQPLYPARPQKTSWAGQISPCRVSSNRSSWMRPMRRRAFCDFGLAVRTMAANGAKGNSTIRSAPLGECSGNACSGNPRAYAVRSCAPEACFFSSTTSPPTPVPCSPSKNLVG